jgi:hypothetical protein
MTSHQRSAPDRPPVAYLYSGILEDPYDQAVQARRAHKMARERYEGLTKAELSDQLAKRELPKTGNVDALIGRLVEADSK